MAAVYQQYFLRDIYEQNIKAKLIIIVKQCQKLKT